MRVVELWRYPVKSLQGERLDEAEIGPVGIVGDRQWGLVDLATGLTLTARREPQLLFAAARLTGPDEVAIELPDGTLAADDAALSAWLGRDVELRRAGAPATYEIAEDFEDEDGSAWHRWQGPAWSLHDSTRTHVSVLGTGSIGKWDVRRFRGNVIVEAGLREEHTLEGCRVRLGTAVLDAGGPIERCVMTTRAQRGGIARDLDVLRTIIAERDNQLGVKTLVVTPGRAAVGDALA